MTNPLTASSSPALKLLAAVGLTLCCTAVSATVIDLRNAGANGGGFGNSLMFSADGIGLTVTGFGETGAESPADSDFFLLEPAEVYSWATGIGVCNSQEGIVSGNCTSSEHEVDTVGRDDLVLFQFDQVVNFERLTVDPFNGPGSDPNDRNVFYWVGNGAGAPILTTETFFTLGSLAGFAAEVESTAISSFSPFTHSLSGTGNLLLLSGDYLDRDCVTSNTSWYRPYPCQLRCHCWHQHWRRSVSPIAAGVEKLTEIHRIQIMRHDFV